MEQLVLGVHRGRESEEMLGLDPRDFHGLWLEGTAPKRPGLRSSPRFSGVARLSPLSPGTVSFMQALARSSIKD